MIKGLEPTQSIAEGSINAAGVFLSNYRVRTDLDLGSWCNLESLSLQHRFGRDSGCAPIALCSALTSRFRSPIRKMHLWLYLVVHVAQVRSRINCTRLDSESALGHCRPNRTPPLRI